MNRFFILDAARKVDGSPPVLELWLSLIILGLNEPVKALALQHLFQSYGFGAMRKTARLLCFLLYEGYVEVCPENEPSPGESRLVLSPRGQNYLNEMSASLIAVDAALKAQMLAIRPSAEVPRAD